MAMEVFVPLHSDDPALSLDRDRLPLRVAEILRQRILDGSILAGERLVEADLAQAFSASRSTIRASLQLLIADGLVEVRPFKGAITRSLTRKDAEEIMALRSVIDPLAARLAAETINPDKVRGLRERLDKLLSLSGDKLRRERITADLDIHRFIVDCSDNALLQQIYGLLDNQVRLLLLNVAARGFTTDDLSKQHSWLVEAICEGDGPAAEAAARHHWLEAHRVQSGAASNARAKGLTGLGGVRESQGTPSRKSKLARLSKS